MSLPILESFREREEARRIIIFYITIGTVLMFFSFYKTGMVLNAAGLFVYFIKYFKRPAKKYIWELDCTEITFIDDHTIMIDGKIVHPEEESFFTAENAEKSISTTKDSKEHEKEDKNVVSE